MVRKVAAALRGVRREEQLLSCPVDKLLSESPEGSLSSATKQPSNLTTSPGRVSGATQQLNNLTTSLHVLSPLFIPLPRYELIRRLNGLICRLSMRFWGWRLGFADPVLINYVPVLAEAMGGRRRAPLRLLSCSADKLLSESPAGSLPSATEQPNNLTTGRVSGVTEQPSNLTTTPRAPRVVYHCVDRWDAFAMYDAVMMREMDRRCCQYADLVIASAGELYERCKVINPHTVLIPHGVDWEHFRRGERVSGYELSVIRNSNNQQPLTNNCGVATIGFFGLLSEWVDQELILKLAQEFPSATIVLIGKADVDVTRLQGVANIQLLGPKPFSELPAYVARFTVGIIPFVVNDLTRSVNPIKLREMLSAGCPVVSTALPEVARYAGDRAATPRPAVWGGCPHPPFPGPVREADGDIRPTPGMARPSAVQVAGNPDEFVQSVRRVLAHPFTLEERRAISDSMASETWTAKVGEILALLTNNR
jgi:glycosyltransferase involved in cell wall biosynthesis